MDLGFPTIANFDLAISGVTSVPDDKVVGHAIFHAANVAMVAVEGIRVSFCRRTVVDDDVFPSAPRNIRSVDLALHVRCQVTEARFALPHLHAVIGSGGFGNRDLLPRRGGRGKERLALRRTTCVDVL